MLTQTSPWFDFYKNRINSTYQDYFEQRYAPLLNFLYNKPIVKEEGIGIGSVAKALRRKGVEVSGSDISQDMVDLALENNDYDMLAYEENILNNPVYTYDRNTTVVTHGVLEHFEDYQILAILEKYKRHGVSSIHYVPTNGYDTPSFGDERLLPPAHWISIFKPTEYLLFNDDKDLLLTFNN